MQTAREDRIRDIFDEVARGSNLDRALGLIADQIAADLGAPTCKIWVVKRGDICERCPLASTCNNRQMCMHLMAASGAAMDKEYLRVPLALFSAALIARGGASDFSDPNGAGEKLFGLQHGAQSEARDSYALFPLRGSSGTVGLIGVFNHRPIEHSEIVALAKLAPAAVAAIRMAELHSRCDSLKVRLEKEVVAHAALEATAARRERELEDAAAQLTHLVAQVQVERDSLLRESEAAQERLGRLEEENRMLCERAESLASQQHESGRAYSEMAAQLESERRRIEEENAWLKGRVSTLEQNVAETARQREALASENDERKLEVERLKSEVETERAGLHATRDALRQAEEQVHLIEGTNAGLRDHNAAISESLEDLERTLRIAEDARARLEQARAALETRVAEVVEEAEQLRRENDWAGDENRKLTAEVERLREEKERLVTETNRLRSFNEQFSEQFVSEVDRLRTEMAQLQAAGGRLREDNNRLGALNREMAEERARSEEHAARLEEENRELADANSQLDEAVKRLESLTARLEDGVHKLRDRAEASDRARLDLEQRCRTLSEQNRRISLDGQAKTRFLANMSHELRTPMNAIIGFTSLLSEDRSLELSDRHRRNLDRVSRNARDLLELINNVLDLSKIDAGRMDVYSEAADPRDLIERAVAVVEPLKEGRPVSLAVETEENLPTLHTDRTKLQQILINLLSNGLKFTPEGEVRVRAERAGLDRIRIVVSDTGIGIAESDLPKLFEEFRQAGSHRHAARQGTGLGLAITRRLVELLGGEIAVSSRQGEGSTFTVTLPVEIEGRIAAAAGPEMPADPERTALVVATDPASLYLMKKYLIEAGYSVAATDEAARGVEIARLARPSVVLIDLDSLEGGIEMIARTAEEHKDGLIVAASADRSAQRQAIRSGASAFLRKPVERDSLIRALEQKAAGAEGSMLVVDDDPDALDLVVAMLEDSGFETVTATTGREAIDRIAEAKPDCIILDLMLPEMDGFEVVHRLSLNPEWQAIPIILITARDLSHEERRALDTGVTRIIQKAGFTRDELLAEIRALATAQPGDMAVIQGRP
jgi:signal transduction histidine kinase/DNA-binding response OmpR family regulator